MNYIKRYSFVEFQRDGALHKGIIEGSYNNVCGFPFYQIKKHLSEQQIENWMTAHDSYSVYIIEGGVVVNTLAWVDDECITVIDYDPVKALAMVQLYEVGK